MVQPHLDQTLADKGDVPYGGCQLSRRKQAQAEQMLTRAHARVSTELVNAQLMRLGA